MTIAQLARRLADFDARLTAMERGPRLSHASIEVGALVVHDESGQPVLTVGHQADGEYGVVGLNGGVVVATDLNLPAGSITETDISDDAISTPKLTANAVTADKIEAGSVTADKVAANAITADKIAAGSVTADKLTADAINGRTITGGEFYTDTVVPRLEIGRAIHQGENPTLRFNIRNLGWDEPSIQAGYVDEIVSPDRFLALHSGLEPDGRHSHVFLQEGVVEIQSGDDTDEVGYYRFSTDKLRLFNRQENRGVAEISGIGLKLEGGVLPATLGSVEVDTIAGITLKDPGLHVVGSFTSSGLRVTPLASGSSKAVTFNHDYTIYVDNAGSGSSNTRWWLDSPDGGEVVIGPRSSSVSLASFRVRLSATTPNAGNVNMDASGFIRRSTSSARYKTDIQDAAPHLRLDRLRQLRPVLFRDREEVERLGDDAPHHYGLIAEEVAEIGLTEFVAYDDQGHPDGVQYDRLVTGLLLLVRDLERQIEELRTDLGRRSEG
ncbi:tail fiber domain-containing protein [Micromonospora echinospora]